MHAQAGDWLVVARRFDGTHARRGEIISVQAADGAPPYRVRWLDTGHESLIIPGADTRIVTAADASPEDRVPLLIVEGNHSPSRMTSVDSDARATELLANPRRYFAQARKEAWAELDRDIAAKMRRLDPL
jgi:hypothetical protein